ncbi:hypothetical protein ES703_92312 [subsurface metagenome]
MDEREAKFREKIRKTIVLQVELLAMITEDFEKINGST